MATLEYTLLSRAEINSITTPATGRKALVLDGTTIEVGNTGLRDVSGLFVADHVASGRILVQRIGNTVTWSLIGVNLAGSVSSVWSLLANPAGRFDSFRPAYTAAAALFESKTSSARLIINGSGSVDIHYGQAGLGYGGSISYVTNNPWPATLPGVADGQPVGI